MPEKYDPATSWILKNPSEMKPHAGRVNKIFEFGALTETHSEGLGRRKERERTEGEKKDLETLRGQKEKESESEAVQKRN